VHKVAEKRENSYQTKLRKPGEREDKTFATGLSISSYKKNQLSSDKAEKTREKRIKGKEGNFSPPPWAYPA
jgi:hypothetical protein